MGNPSDDATSSIIANNLSFHDAWLILILLIALFLASRAWTQDQIEKARTEVGREMHKIGIEKSDIENNKAKSLIKLQQHPKYARRIQKLAEDAMLSDIAV